MNLRARWAKWEPWREYPSHRERHRELLVAGVSIARLYQMKVTTPNIIFKRKGLYWRLRIGYELSSAYFYTKRDALRRLQ